MTRSILLTEGSSLTSRETLTALHECGYQIDILSSTKLCNCAFSSWKHKIIETVNANDDPLAYLKLISDLVEKEGYRAVVPTHEQAWLISEGRDLLPESMPVLIAPKEVFGQVQGKVAFAQLLDTLGVSQPKWQLLDDPTRVTLSYPFWLKSEYGTAGRAVHKIHSAHELKQLFDKNPPRKNDRLMIQENTKGQYGQVMALFNRGMMIAVHTTLQIGAGVGNSAAARLSIDSPISRSDMRTIGEYLGWHGPITFDFIMKGEQPCYIECNPRMVEPANARYSGVNFPELIIKLSSGIPLEDGLMIGRAGVKTHSLQALLLGTAEMTDKRRIIWQDLRKCMSTKDSIEVLNPVGGDLPSIIPLVAVLVALLVNPRTGAKLASSTVSTYSIQPDTIFALNSDINNCTDK